MAKLEDESIAIDLIVAQAKKVERESRILKQQVARLRENLQSETQGKNGKEKHSRLEEG